MAQDRPPAEVGSTEGLGGVIPRAEWERRYAARVMGRAGWPEHAAIDASKAASEVYDEAERGPYGANSTPEEEADEEMSYWTDDGEG